MNLLSRLKKDKPLRVSEASLVRIRKEEQQRFIAEEADKRRARRKAKDLIYKPQ